jgi:hypothetical protein
LRWAVKTADKSPIDCAAGKAITAITHLGLFWVGNNCDVLKSMDIKLLI